MSADGDPPKQVDVPDNGDVLVQICSDSLYINDEQSAVSALAAGEQRNLVGGDLVGALEGGSSKITTPANLEVIARVADGTQADVERALAAARAVRPGWGRTTSGERIEAACPALSFASRLAGGVSAL